MKADTKSPKKFSKGELKKVGVQIISKEQSIRLECDQCGSQWSPNILSGGRLPKGYWKCPKGCNSKL